MNFENSSLFDPIVSEANAVWTSLQEQHSILNLYKDCAEFYADVRFQTKHWRKVMFNLIRSGCCDVMSKGDNALFILIFNRELTSILYWKATARERASTWSTIMEAFLESVKQGMPFDVIARQVSNAVKRWKDKENFRRGKVLSIDVASVSDPPFFDDEGLEFEGFVQTLLGLDVSEMWLSTILGNINVSVRIQHQSELDTATDYQKKKTRDVIAQKIATDIPELAHLIKERSPHKKRRSCRFP